MLRLKYVPVNTFNECIAYVHKDCNVYKVDDIFEMTRVEIHGGPVTLYAFLNIVSDSTIVGPGELGLNDEAFRCLSLPEGANLTMIMAEAPKSLSYVRKKMHGQILTPTEYDNIVEDIANGKFADLDIASFLTACASFMTAPETAEFVSALCAKSRYHWDEEDIVVNCHTLGEIPGNSTEIIAAAIVAAYGLPMPLALMRQSRSASENAGLISEFTNIEINSINLQRLIKEQRGAFFDYEMLPVARPLKRLQVIADHMNFSETYWSVVRLLALKAACGVTHLVVDIPIGRELPAKNAQDAVAIRKLLEYAGDILGLHVDVVITDGREPIGSGVGAVLEARDVMRVLRGKEDAPKGLQEKALFFAGRILEADAKLRGGQGIHAAKEILTSGRALEAFENIISAQGDGKEEDLGILTRDVLAPFSGEITAIDNRKINKIALLAGANQYGGAGLYLLKKVGDKVTKGEALYKIYAYNSADLALANSYAEGDNAYTITAR